MTSLLDYLAKTFFFYKYLCDMAYIFDIDGEIIPFNHYGELGYVNHWDVTSHLALAGGDDIEVRLNTPGGDVDEALLMYGSIRRYAIENNAKVTMRAVGRCQSSGTILFLSGDERLASPFLEPFFHNAWTYVVGDHRAITKMAVDLEKVNQTIAEFYSAHTNLSVEQAKELMNNDTYLSPQDAVAIRFATGLDTIVRPAALHQAISNNKKSVNMNKNDQNLLSGLKSLFASNKKALNGAKAVVVYTDAQESLDFPDVSEGETPKVGDKATIDGQPANGSYVLADGRTFVFVDGELTEIIEVDDDNGDETLEEEVARLRAENKELKAQANANKSALAAQAKDIKALKDSVSNMDKNWKALESLVSGESVEDTSNTSRSNGGAGATGGSTGGRLASSAGKLRNGGLRKSTN